MTAWAKLAGHTGASTTADDRVRAALLRAGYRIERHDYIVYPSDRRFTGSTADLPSGACWGVTSDGVKVSDGHAMEWQAWNAAAGHALAHHADRLPPAYSGPGSVWPMPNA
jgi:hypothetical protein